MTKFWPGRLWTQLSNLGDAELMRALSPRLLPIPLLASHFVDPAAALPYLGQKKEHDLVMLAHFDRVKRHWLLFDALRRLPRSWRVLLMGVPLSGRTEKDLLAEARAFGVADRFELLLRPSRAEVVSELAKSKVSLIFSRQEGACIAVAEALFADTPVGLFRNARIGSKAFINEQTGVLLGRRHLADQLREFVEKADTFRPRAWAVGRICCHASTALLNEVLRRAAREHGEPWTQDVLPFRNELVSSYLTAQTEAEMRPWYDDFAQRYGLLLGPAARAAFSYSPRFTAGSPVSPP
jgi:glycosyltransferase involved in cell wall biosynthesis